jgi:hypothetical protein
MSGALLLDLVQRECKQALGQRCLQLLWREADHG